MEFPIDILGSWIVVIGSALIAVIVWFVRRFIKHTDQMNDYIGRLDRAVIKLEAVSESQVKISENQWKVISANSRDLARLKGIIENGTGKH